MIQAVQHSSNQLEATKSVEGKAIDELALEGQLESVDFASELKSSLMKDGEKVLQEALNPKAFDPSLTKGVEKANGPQAMLTPEQILELDKIADPKLKEQMLQALLKNPQVKTLGKLPGRSPAIDFAKSEIDPQLLNMEDFVAQKKAVSKKNINQNIYGMNKNVNAGTKSALENGLKSNQVIQDAKAIDPTNKSPMNSQQFILNLMNNDQTSLPKVNDVQGSTKVFDMSHIKTADAEKIMTQITDYVVQAKAAKEPSVSMRVNHEDLGMIDITVQKTPVGSVDAIAVNIGTHTADAKNFFQANSRDLFSHLSTSGLTISDLKVDGGLSSQTSKNDFDFNSQSNRQGFSHERQFGSEQGQRQHDAERRQELWKQFNQEVA